MTRPEAFPLVLLVLLAAPAVACGSHEATNRGGGSSGDNGLLGSASDSGVSGPVLLTGDAGPGSGPSSASLTVTIRDFKFWDNADPATNADFENALGDDRGIVDAVLGPNRKPTYKKGATGTTSTTHGKTSFDQWYRDVPGTNINVQYPLTLTKSNQGTYAYDSLVSGVALSPNDPTKMFFPIDDGGPYATAFGNQGASHNYSFTCELHTVFIYNGGESFSFSGDDDVFVFINGNLAIDLGGVHARQQAAVQLDSLGLVRGSQYPLDLFSAERHTSESNLSFTTTLDLKPSPIAQ